MKPRRHTQEQPRSPYGTPSLAWAGALQRTPDGIRGRLADQHDWELLLSGDISGDVVELSGSVVKQGGILGPWSDDGLRDRLCRDEQPLLRGHLRRIEGAWTGALDSVQLTGTTTAPGHIALRGQG